MNRASIYLSAALGISFAVPPTLAANDLYLALRGSKEAVEDFGHGGGLESIAFLDL